MSNKVIFIAGGIWQRPFVKYLKDKGYSVAIVNPVANATTILADYHIKSDINNLEEINKHIEILNPIFITSDQSDVSSAIVATLSKRWGLPSNDVDVVERFTNKLEICKFGKSIGIPVPETAPVRCADDVKNFAKHNGFPVIIKPIDSTNSRGFRKIHSIEEITDETFDVTANFSKTKQVITQIFIPGNMATLEGVCSGGKHKTIANSIKSEYFKPGINTHVRYPSTLPANILKKITDANDLYVETGGMQFGLTHSEYIINNTDCYLIEIGCRGGGAGITDKIVPWVSGINVYDILHNSLIGNTVDVKMLTPLRRSAILQYYQEKDLINCNEQKIDLISKIPGVAAFHYNFIGNQYSKDNYDNRHTVGVYLAESDSEIECILKKVNDIIK